MKYGKHVLIFIFFLVFCVISKAQRPLSWNYAAKKLNDSVYNIHIVATIGKGWHIYSQHQPGNAIAIPAKIKFSINPLVKFDGEVEEIGKMIKYEDNALGISDFEYEEHIDFKQKVILKRKVKTYVGGIIIYQLCSGEKCLPAKTIAFSIPIL